MADLTRLRLEDSRPDDNSRVELLVGTKAKPRLLAMIADNVLASLIAVLMAAKVPGLDDVGRGGLVVTAYLSYYLISEGFWAQTAMKRAFGLIVRRIDGHRAGWKEAIIRTGLRLIEVNPLLLGALPGGLAVALSSRRQRLGDMLAKTVVVLVNERPLTAAPRVSNTECR